MARDRVNCCQAKKIVAGRETSSIRSLECSKIFHSRLLDMGFNIGKSGQRASLAIYHFIFNARSWNNLLNGLDTKTSSKQCEVFLLFKCKNHPYV